MRLAKVSLMTIAVSVAAVAADPDPFVGTWKLNAAKSRFEGSRAYKSATVQFKAESDGLLQTGEYVDSDGTATNVKFKHVIDGKPHPRADGRDGKITRTRPNPHTLTGTFF